MRAFTQFLATVGALLFVLVASSSSSRKQGGAEDVFIQRWAFEEGDGMDGAQIVF